MDGIYPYLDVIMFEAVLNVPFKYNIIHSRHTNTVGMNTFAIY